MKPLLILLAFTLLFISCIATQPKEPVCERPGAEKSIICDIAKKHNFTPEDVYYGLLDGATIALIASKHSEEGFLTKAMIGAYINDIRQYLVDNEFITVADVVTQMIDRAEMAEDAELVAGILHRRIEVFRDDDLSLWVLPEFDRSLLIEAMDSYLEDLFISPEVNKNA